MAFTRPVRCHARILFLGVIVASVAPLTFGQEENEVPAAAASVAPPVAEVPAAAAAAPVTTAAPAAVDSSPHEPEAPAKKASGPLSNSFNPLKKITGNLNHILNRFKNDFNFSKVNVSYMADIDKSGPCKDSLAKHCADVAAGDGARAHCLRQKMNKAVKNHEENPLDNACAKNVKAFMLAMAHDAGHPEGLSVALSPHFRAHCKADQKSFCEGRMGPALIGCLKFHKAKLSESCQSEVSQVQAQESHDMALDANFMTACASDLDSLPDCANIKVSPITGTGKRKACLIRHRKDLGENCTGALFTREQQDAQNLKFDQDTYSECRAEIKKYCKIVSFGQGKMIDCLWKKREESEFGVDCKAKVEAKSKRAVQDFRLNYGVLTRCVKDIDDLCATEKAKVNAMTETQMFGQIVRREAGEVLHCLKENYKSIQDSACKQHVKHVAKIHNADSDADSVLTRKCASDMSQFCPGVATPKIHQCLRKNMDSLSVECKDVELVQGAIEAHDVNIKQGILKACQEDKKVHCNDVPSGDGKVIMCLQKHVSDTEMEPACKKAVEDDLEASQHDWRLKYGFKESCMQDASTLCPYDTSEGGVSLFHCLTKNLGKITQSSCELAVKDYVKKGVANIKFAPYTYSKCMPDVEYLCPGVEFGSGRVHKCLMEQKSMLSAECAAAEFEIQKAKAYDITLSIKAVSACKEDMTKKCKDVKPGNGMMWRCLEDNADQLTTPYCKDSIKAHTRLKNSEFYLNPQLTDHCEAEAEKFCKSSLDSAKTKDFSNEGSVIKCLIHHNANITSRVCKFSLMRKLLQRIESLDNDPVAFAECATDAATHCPEFTFQENPKAVTKCMSIKVWKLSAGCRKIQMAIMGMQSADLKLNVEMSTQCAAPAEKLCKDEQAGTKIGCLLDHMHSSDMDGNCFKELEKETFKRSRSITFNPMLQKWCSQDLKALKQEGKCPSGDDAPGPAGAVFTGYNIDCLTEHAALLKNDMCKNQVTKTLARQSDDVRAKLSMATACDADIKELCTELSPGRGMVHSCLREKINKIQSDECKKHVLKAQEAEQKNFVINPQVRRNCVNERKAYCPMTEQGGARVLICLNINKAKEGFSDACRKALKQVKVDNNQVNGQKEAENQRVALAVSQALAEVKAWMWQKGGLNEEGGATFLIGSLVGMIMGAAVLGLSIFLCCRRCRGSYQEIDSMA